MDTDKHSDEEIRKILTLKNIAVVGMSKHPEKDAHIIPNYLIDAGYNVIPVNPTAKEILGRKSYTSVAEVPDRIDIVDVFRPSEDVPSVVNDVLKKPGIKVIWLQEGIHNKEAEEAAKKKGIDVVYNRCMMVEHGRLSGE